MADAIFESGGKSVTLENSTVALCPPIGISQSYNQLTNHLTTKQILIMTQAHANIVYTACTCTCNKDIIVAIAEGGQGRQTACINHQGIYKDSVTKVNSYM